MSEHINGWLVAYFDGQLGERRTKKVEDHLNVCETCREELEKLNKLRVLLQENPEVSGITPPHHFVAQVGLRLQPRSAQTGLQQTLSAMWIALPVVLLGVWAFEKTLITLTGLTDLAFMVGLWSDFASAVSPTPSSSILSSLPWQIWLSILTGLISLSWLASWWISQNSNKSQKRTE